MNASIAPQLRDCDRSLDQISVKHALMAANGLTVRDGGKRWKIEVRETFSTYLGYAVFSCHAQDLDPKDEDEARYCIMDLWRSESARAARILAKAVQLGCRFEHATI